MILLIAAIMGAIANRLRGGAINFGGNLPGRLAWAVTCALIAEPLGLPLPWCAALAAAAFLGTLFGQYGALDMSHRSGMPWPQAALRITLYGAARALPVALVLAIAGRTWWPMAAATLAAVPAYDLPWRLPDACLRLRYLGRGTGPGPARDPPELAEALHGAALALALAACLLP